MRELGQYLAGPASFFTTPSPWALAGLATLGATLLLVTVFLLRPLARDVRVRTLLLAIPLLTFGSVLAVLLLQLVAEEMHHNILQAARPVMHGGGGRNLIGKFIFLILAYIVGWGYSQSLQDVTFGEHVLSFTVGVGILEELVKAFVALGLCHCLWGDGFQIKKNPGRLAFAFAITGLCFGVGEAIHYFQVYAAAGADWSYYLLRGSWCVLLQASWSCLVAVGLTILRFDLGSDYRRRVDPWVNGGKFLLACTPSVLLHGIYDACALHETGGMWLLGLCCVGLFVLGVRLVGESAILPELVPEPQIRKAKGHGKRKRAR